MVMLGWPSRVEGCSKDCNRGTKEFKNGHNKHCSGCDELSQWTIQIIAVNARHLTYGTSRL